MDAADAVDDSGEVPLQVKAEGQEVRYHYDARRTAADESLDSAGQVGIAKFQKCGLDEREIRLLCEAGGSGANGFVGRFDAGAVAEYRDSDHARRDGSAAGFCRKYARRKSMNARPFFRPLLCCSSMRCRHTRMPSTSTSRMLFMPVCSWTRRRKSSTASCTRV